MPETTNSEGDAVSSRPVVTVEEETRISTRRRRKPRQTVLIVEDEPLNRQVIKRYLGVLGYRVLQAERGDDGLNLAREENPDLVILDNHLPGLSGLEVAARLREGGFPGQMVMMSAYDLSPQQRKQLQELGIRGFLRKPFAFSHLQGLIKFAVNPPRFVFRRSRLYYRQPNFSLTSRTLAQQIFQTVFREGLDLAGHVHFHVREHSDHLVLLCSRKTLGKVIAKSEECGKGECIPWDRSSFRDYNQEKVLRDLSQEINLVRIDAADYQMSWPTLADFICWVELSYS